MSDSSCGIVVASTLIPAARVFVAGGAPRVTGAVVALAPSRRVRVDARMRRRRTRLLITNLHGIGWGMRARGRGRYAGLGAFNGTPPVKPYAGARRVGCAADQ